MQIEERDSERDARRFVVVLERGDEIVESLGRLAREHQVEGAFLSGIGAVRGVTIAWYDLDSQEYRDRRIEDQLEVVSLIGNLGRTADGEPMAHVHAGLARADVSMIGGHLKEATVSPTLELWVEESGIPLSRRLDESCGLPLIRLNR